jgi:hypothetical protein
MATRRELGLTEEAAWTYAEKHKDLIGLTSRRMYVTLEGNDSFKREVLEMFVGDGPEVLHNAALNYDVDGKASFKTYASKALEHALYEAIRKVKEQRGEGPKRGLRGEKKKNFSTQTIRQREIERNRARSRDQGLADIKQYSPIYDRGDENFSVGERNRLDQEILDMIRESLHILPDNSQDLTRSEGRAVGFYLWGPDLPQVRYMYKNHFYQLMINHILAEPLTHREVATLMGTGVNGWPYTPDSVEVLLRQAARKLNSSDKKSLRTRAMKGLEASIIRIEVLKRQGRYEAPKHVPEDDAVLSEILAQAELVPIPERSPEKKDLSEAERQTLKVAS